MDQVSSKKNFLASGWILVTGLLVLCVIGTGLTWWNYSRQVFSSADGVIVQSEGNDGVIKVRFGSDKLRLVQIGHGATVTVGEDRHPIKGRVTLVVAGKVGTQGMVMIHVKDAPIFLPSGARCSVTIDTTVPPMEGDYK